MALVDKLISWWTMDEESGARADSHGGHNLTDNNTVTFAAGKKGNAADFIRANNEYLSHADHADFSANGHAAFMITCWAKLDNTTANQTIVGKYGTANEWLLWYYVTNDRFRWNFRKNDDSGDLPIDADNLGAPADATWYFVVAWHDPVADVIAIQVNNGVADTLAFAFGGRDTTDPLTVGDCGLANFNLDGNVDELAFWDTILTAAEKTWLYNGGSARSYADLTATGGGPRWFF